MMDIDEVMKLLPHRYPFLMIDRVVELDPGQSVRAIKCVTVNEPQFQGHFPSEPIFPGVLLIEAFAQAAGIVALSANPDETGQLVYLMGIDKVRFKHPVRPGDRVEILCEKIYERRRIWRFAATAQVDGRVVATGEVVATIPDEAMRERARS